MICLRNRFITSSCYFIIYTLAIIFLSCQFLLLGKFISRNGKDAYSLAYSFNSTSWSNYNNEAKLKPVTGRCDNCDFDLARRESLGFFDDIPSPTWELMKQKVRDMAPNFNAFYLPFSRGLSHRIYNPGTFYQNNYEPDFVCQHERRIGRLGDGGKWICDPHRIASSEDCLVYSVGSNNDFSFELSVLKEIGQHCEIHTFDFGDYAEGARKVGYRIHNGENKSAVNYHRIGLGEDNPPRLKSLSTIVKELGHENRTIDIFKIDCEGCEWTSARKWFDADVTLRQIQVELHKSDPYTTPQFFDMMYEQNYVITHKESNIEYTGPDDVAIEYAFLKLSPDFFSGYERAKGYAG